MDKTLRSRFNNDFTEEKYQAYEKQLENLYPGQLDFRNSETPIFVPADFRDKVLHASEEIVDVIVAPGFKELTERSIPADVHVPGEDAHTQFLVFDFGICKNDKGEIEPQLIEMQGFPTLFAYQAEHSELTATYANLPDTYSAYLNGYDKESYLKLLKEIILGEEDPENVVLLEIYPEQQKTRIDFAATKALIGLNIVCLTKVYAEADKLYYDLDGRKVQIKRIYNRVIFDDLHSQEELGNIVDLQKPYDVKWIPHPNWFYRISKFTLPFIHHKFVPQTFFLNEAPADLDLNDYVLKPLFSFAGMGVVIDVTKEDIDKINDPENWILQRKVNYDSIIPTPDEPAKGEIRIFYFWKEGWDRPVAVHNLARMSKGKMIGTRYNKNKNWVGGSVAFFEKQ